MEVSNQEKSLTSSYPYSDKKALVVEDLETIRKATVNMLLELGFETVLSVKDGREALNILAENDIDLILSDWLMPQLNGLDLLIKVRSTESTKNVPFVMSTVVVDQALIRQAIHAGVSEYVIKPFTYSTFSERILNAFTQPLDKRMGLSRKAELQAVGQDIIGVEMREIAPPKLQVLIVDDVADNIQVISEIIKPLAKVRAVTNGKGALKICNGSMPPDLILLDIMMPEMDGYQVIEQLKSNPATREIPVIFLTAKSEVYDITRGFELGAVDYVTKPVQPAVLVSRVNNQTRIINYQNSLRSQVDTLLENIRLREDIDRIVRHDLNNPLTAVLGAAEQINMKAGDSTLIKQNSEIIMQSAMLIHNMVNNLSLLSKVEERGFTLETRPLLLSDTLQQVAVSFPKEVQAKSLQVELDISTATMVMGDKSMLYSLFANLFKNAVDAAPGGSKIEILENLTEDKVEITVANLGAVPEEIRGSFFNKYVTKGKQHGTGLGTYSAMLISRAHGGDIRLQAGENETKVIVTLLQTL